MRILYLIRDPYPTTRQDVLTLFGRRLSAKGIASDIVATVRPGASPASVTWPGGQAFLVCGARNPLIRALQIVVHDLRLLRRIGQYDALVVRDRILAALLAMIVARRVPVCYWMSFPFPEEDILRSQLPGRSNLYRFALLLRGALSGWLLYRIVVPRASHLFVQSERMAATVRRKAAIERAITVVPMGVDEQQLRNLSGPRLVPALEGRFVLAYLGALDRVRRIDFLLDLIVWLKLRSPDVALLLIGDASTPEDRLWLSRRIEKMGLDGDVITTGQLPIGEAWTYLRSARIGLSAIPRGEVFDVASPTKVVEYLALGIPVVVNDIPDQRQLVEATGAGLCVEMNVEKFGRAVMEISADYVSYKQRALTCVGDLLSTRGYDHLSSVVNEALLSVRNR